MRNIYYICTKTLKNDVGIIQFAEGNKYKVTSISSTQLVLLNERDIPHIVTYTTNASWANHFIKYNINKILNEL